MKIRCIENHVRYRVRKSDIALLREDGKCSSSVKFAPDAIFRYSLVTSQHSTVKAEFNGGEIIIYLPINEFRDWADSNAVGIEKEIAIDEGAHLTLLIEKDFPCKDRDEDISDTFFELHANENC